MHSFGYVIIVYEIKKWMLMNWKRDAQIYIDTGIQQSVQDWSGWLGGNAWHYKAMKQSFLHIKILLESTYHSITITDISMYTSMFSMHV